MKKIILVIFITLSIFSKSDNIIVSKKILEEESKIEKNLLEFFNSIKFFNNNNALKFIVREKENDVVNNTIDNIFNKKVIEKIDINKKNKYGESPLIIAIEYKNNFILDKLLENGVNLDVKHPILGKYPIHTAVYFNNIEAVKKLLSINKDMVNYQNNNDGWTPLQDAVLKGNVEMVKLLLENGANPLLRDFSNNYAMDLAANFNKGEIVKLLRNKIKEVRNNK